VVPASFFGTYLTMVLMMVGIRLSPAAVAAVLLATSPVFGLLLESAAGRRWPDGPSVVGTVVAIAGVAVLSLG
jgi:drug/metabolite transporter (DMT)-like permease